MPTRNHVVPHLDPQSARFAHAAPRSHVHFYEVSEILFCLEECADAHLTDHCVAHQYVAYYASTLERAEAFIQAHAHQDVERAWEVWERVLDEYAPFEEADDLTAFWQYAGDGQRLNPYEWWDRYERPLYRWAWTGWDGWRLQAEARRA